MEDLGNNGGSLLFERGERLGQGYLLSPNISLRKDQRHKKRTPQASHTYVAHPPESEHEQGQQWYRKAAQGYASAQFNLGLVYWQGKRLETRLLKR